MLISTLVLATLHVLGPAPAPARPGPALRARQEPVQDPALAQPNFEAYFPDDPEGGAALDALYRDRGARGLDDDAYIAAVRGGLRRTTEHKLTILRDFGNRFVWGKAPQRAEAIELMFHAADPRPAADRYGTRHPAVYFGLSVVTDKTPRILDALVAIAMASEAADTIGRIAWGTSSERDEMIGRLGPHLASEDPAVREKAEDLRRIFAGEESAQQWTRRRAKARARAEYAAELPGIRAALRGGTSAERRAALDRLWETRLILIMDRASLADFEAAALDPDASVRRDVVRITAGEWIWGTADQDGRTIDLALRMSRDEDPQVRYDAVYYGLSTVRESRRDVVERMLEMLAEPEVMDLSGRLQWGLRSHGDRVREVLLGTLEGESASREQRISAATLFRALLDEEPPVKIEGVSGPEDLLGRWRAKLSTPDGRAATTEFVVARAGDGFTLTSSFDGEERTVRLLVSRHGAGVAAGAALDEEGGGLVITMSLAEGRLDGVVMLAHERLLMPFTGER